MTEIMQSIHKNWTCLILTGEKTLELRKNKPTNVKYPIKVFMYESKILGGSGMVVGEYILKSEPSCYLFDNRDKLMDLLSKNSCVDPEGIIRYQHGKGTVYAWRTSNSIKYDEPKQLREFGMNKAPQSWCYINR